jgi:hypothetical protein
VLVNIYNRTKITVDGTILSNLKRVTAVKYEVLMVVVVKSTIFCSLVGCSGVSVCLVYSSTLKMEAVLSSDTSYQSTWYNIPKDSAWHKNGLSSVLWFL